MAKSSHSKAHERSESRVEPVAAAPAGLRAGIGLLRLQGSAQQQFEKATREGQLMLHGALLDAQRQYASRMEEVQRDFERLAIEAYQSYLTSLADTSAGSAAAERSTDAYEEMIRSTTALSGQGAFGQAVQDAYQELIAALGAASAAQPGAATDNAEPYRRFGTRLYDAWNQARELQTRSGQAYVACVSAWQEATQQRQCDLSAAYEAYMSNLEEARARSDYERRAAEAAKEYAAAAEAAWKQAQHAYSDAVLALVNDSKRIVDSLHLST
jgi:hypothetical protein